MSAEAVGRHMPSVVTLDDLAAMMTADGHHRYEISPEGVLSVLPPPGYAHAIIATRLMDWLLPPYQLSELRKGSAYESPAGPAAKVDASLI